MKRFTGIICVLLSVVSSTLIFSACEKNVEADLKAFNKASDGKLSIVCTIFPPYDWVRQILGDTVDNIDLTLLLGNGVDMHSYQPTVDDIINISTCDLFIYVGGESDGWVDNALAEALNPDMIVINLIDTLGDAARVEEITEGMQEEKNDEESAYDEHVWLSLKNTELFCSEITNALSSLDSSNADKYKNNLAAYTEKLSTLDKEYQETITEASNKTLLFGDRFPCRYLVDDYGINYYAAFPGCSAETEASFETIIFLAGKTDELNLRSIMVTETSNQSIAKTIINNTGTKDQQILVLDSMQSVTLDKVRDGISCLSIMESNLSILKEALK